MNKNHIIRTYKPSPSTRHHHTNHQYERERETKNRGAVYNYSPVHAQPTSEYYEEQLKILRAYDTQEDSMTGSTCIVMSLPLTHVHTHDYLKMYYGKGRGEE